MSEQQDAEWVVRFYELRRESRLREARSFLVGQFKAKNLQELNEVCPPGSEENASFRQAISYWDMVAAIVKRCVADRELFFETNGEITVVWEKVRHVLPELRESTQNPQFLKNLEDLARAREAYIEGKSPGYLEALRQRLGLS